MLAMMVFLACAKTQPELPPANTGTNKLAFPEKIANATIYEANIRQHTPEGTFEAFTEDIPRLKELGVSILWIMPIHPIGVENRKLPLGSYYSVMDYRGVNKEFGTIEDFKLLVDKAHTLDMYVILDWVPNHTARDHEWITEHPEYYIKDEKGNITYEKISEDDVWWDTALLNHKNPETRKAMIDEMRYWVEEIDIDGFRCDHAGHEIPLYFWEEAIAELDQIKDLFWLAEWEGARMHITFDATYGWELLSISEDIVKGAKTADELAHWIEDDMHEYGRDAFRLTMITNHDKNSWNGTIFERFGREAHKTFAALIFTAYGIPMIYGGQEVGLNKRLLFFDKDSIDWSDPMSLQPFYQRLIGLKANNPALAAGSYGGITKRINEDKHVYAFKREKNNNRVIGIFNLSDSEQMLHITDPQISGGYQEYFSGEDFNLSSEPLALAPWQYLIFITP
jgi:glycosidase